eukprot:TCALIF_11574-PA protein Name:"Protein of unknown function" AED:0.23 eAED:0.23 QI:0/0.33/0/0.75/1/1/4/0/317
MVLASSLASPSLVPRFGEPKRRWLIPSEAVQAQKNAINGILKRETARSIPLLVFWYFRGEINTSWEKFQSPASSLQSNCLTYLLTVCCQLFDSHSNRRSISSSDDSKSSSAVLETFETGSPFQAKRETVPSKMDHSITTSSHHPPNLSESHMAAALSHYDHPNDLIQATMVDNNLARVQLAEAENFDAESEDDEGEEDDEDEKEEPGNVNEEAVERDSSRQANNGEAMKAAIVLGSVPGPSSNDRTTPNVIGPLESIEAGVEYGFVLDDEEIEEEARFLVVCIDGDVEDLVLLLEDMARAGETLTKEMLNYPDNSGR